MILVAFGANLRGPFGTPIETIKTAAGFLADEGINIVSVSSLYLTPPFGPGRQPSYINGVGRVKTHLAPSVLLDTLHRIEFRCGRRRSIKWGPRTLDLDLLAYNRLVTGGKDHGGRRDGLPLLLPHPQMANRAFVMAPLAELAPYWVHPRTGDTAARIWQLLEHTIEARKIKKACGPEWVARA